jgi:branched-chain amino acid transport system permease protein
MGVLNFAHAGFFMLGAHFALQVGRYLRVWAALILASLIVNAIGP